MDPFVAALLLIVGGFILVTIASKISFSIEKHIKRDKDLQYEEHYNAYGKRYKILARNPYSNSKKTKSNLKIVAADTSNTILFVLYLFGMMMIAGGIIGFVESL